MPLLFENKSADKPDISVILPSLRPEKARKCIDSIAETSEGVNYEVVVVSPLNMSELLLGCQGYHRIKFVHEEKKEGSCKANTLGYENAAGKYVFAMADDQRLGQDCLKNLIGFMRPHDQEIFLAGARCCGVYGAAPECKTYGFYYAFNPCIRRDLVQPVGGFYDPYYKSYYGDPDLSMRVWHHGGRVELCPDAWVEFHNEFDDLDFESHDDYAERDFKAFFERWHPIYGHLVKSSNEMDINVGNKYAFPGIPPEKCTRLIVFLRKRDWAALKNELESEHNFRLNRDHLFYVFEDMLKHLDWIFIPAEIQQNLAKWLIKQLLVQASFSESEADVVFINGEVKSGIQYPFKPEPANILLAKIAMFLLVNETLKRNPVMILDNYKGISLISSSRKYYAWPCSYGGFSIQAFKEKADNFAFCERSIYQTMMRIEELTGNHTFFAGQSVRDIEDYFTSGPFERLPNDQNTRQVFEQLPDEICLKLMFCLRLKDWAGIEYLLNNTKEKAFMMRYHISFLYGEILRKIPQIPSHIVLRLSQWLWQELYASSISVQNITEEQDSHVRLVVPGYRDFNIVYYKGGYYGWPGSAGGFSLANYLNGIVPTAVAGKSPLEVKKLIDRNSARSTQEEENKHDWITIQQDEAVITSYEMNELDNDIRLVVQGYRQYNIVCCKGLYYGWPWAAGRFSLVRYLNGFDQAAVAGTSIIEVKNRIDARLGPPAAEEENQHDWSSGRFLLIKHVGAGFWSDMHDVWAKLLLAEITNRHPIVYWGESSQYSVGENSNSFEEYFLPVSEYSIRDVVSDQFTYYPPVWNHLNVLEDDPDKMSHVYRDIPDFINSDANVVVSDTHHCILYKVLPWVKEGHPVYGLWGDDVCRYVITKYQKLRPDISDEIDAFYHAHHMETGPVLAVHIRSGNKIREIPHLLEINAEYPQEIDSYLKDNPTARIFMLTDDEDVLEQYKQRYGDILFYTDCHRKRINGLDPDVQVFPDRRRKGIEILKDSYLASQCDAFIGNGHSVVSIAISRLKVWDKGSVKLIWKPLPPGF